MRRFCKFFVFFALMLLVFINTSNIYAVDCPSATTKINEIKTRTGLKPGSSYGDGGCWLFVNAFCNAFYGVGAPGGTSGYQLNNPGNYGLVGRLSVSAGNISQSNVKALLLKAYPGDIMQICSNNISSVQHTAIVENVSDAGITIYEHVDPAYGGVRSKYRSWSEFFSSYAKFDRSCDGISLYHYNSYPYSTPPSPEEPETLEMPKISVEKTEWYDYETITFSWQECKKADYYFPQIYNENGRVAVRCGGTSTTFSADNIPPGNYYLQVASVRTSDVEDAIVLWSSAIPITVTAGVELPKVSIEKTEWYDYETITFSWQECKKADFYYPIIYNENGRVAVRWGGTSTTFSADNIPPGNYYVYVISNRDYDVEDTIQCSSASIPITVVKSDRHTKSNVTKKGMQYTIETALHDFVAPYDLLIVGYKENQLVTMKIVPHSEQNSPCILEGDIDKIKVMVWSDLSTLKPLCNAEKITSDKFIIE